MFFSENDYIPKGNLERLYNHFKTIENVKTKGCFFNKYRGVTIIEKVKGVIAIAFADIIVVDNYVSFLNILNL